MKQKIEWVFSGWPIHKQNPEDAAMAVGVSSVYHCQLKGKTMIRENMEMDISMTTCNSNIAPPVLFVCFCFLKYSPLLLAIWSSKPLITHLGWQRSHRYMSGICCLSIPMQSMCCQTLKKTKPQIFSYFKQNFRNCVCAWHMYLFFHRDLKIRLKNKT